MSREYSISTRIATLSGSGAITLLFLRSAVNCSLEILRIWIQQAANVTSAQQRVQIVTQVTAFPTVTSLTPGPLKRGDPISQIVGGTAGAAGTCGVNASAEGAGAKSVIFEEAFNVIPGYLWVPTEREKIVLPASYASGLGIYFPVAPGTLTEWIVGLNYAEV